MLEWAECIDYTEIKIDKQKPDRGGFYKNKNQQ